MLFYHIILCYNILYYIISYYIILYYIMLYYIILYYITIFISFILHNQTIFVPEIDVNPVNQVSLPVCPHSPAWIPSSGVLTTIFSMAAVQSEKVKGLGSVGGSALAIMCTPLF